jgi:hypothetical protein
VNTIQQLINQNKIISDGIFIKSPTEVRFEQRNSLHAARE